VEVIATPGHTPDSIALIDRENKLLFTGDTYYPAPIWLYRPETDLTAYAKSIQRLAALAPEVNTVLGAHNIPVAQPEVLPALVQAFRGPPGRQSRLQARRLREENVHGGQIQFSSPRGPLRSKLMATEGVHVLPAANSMFRSLVPGARHRVFFPLRRSPIATKIRGPMTAAFFWRPTERFQVARVFRVKGHVTADDFFRKSKARRHELRHAFPPRQRHRHRIPETSASEHVHR